MGFQRRLYTDPTDVSAVAGGAITGGKAVSLSGGSPTKPTVAQGSATAKPFGFAEYDAATGEVVNIIKRGVLRGVTLAEAASAGAMVTTDANGDLIVTGATDANKAGFVWNAGASGDTVTLDLQLG